MDLKDAREKICMALDFDEKDTILSYVEELHDYIGYFKINYAFTMFGSNLIKEIKSYGVKLFLDLKLCDIPNTMAGYGRAVVQQGIDIINIHTSGGLEMMQTFVDSVNEECKKLNVSKPLIIGVTLTTNINQSIMNEELNIQGDLATEVLRKAKLAEKAGLNGIVCSATELSFIKKALPEDFFYITPGVRASNVSIHDHKRVVTFAEAIKMGSSLLVIGRDLLAAEDRREYVKQIINQIAERE